MASEEQQIELPKSSYLNKIRNISSFKDFSEKLKGKIEIWRRNASFIIHDWMISMVYGKHKKNVFGFHIDQEDIDQLKNILDTSKKDKLSPDHQVKGKRGPPKPDKNLYEQMNKTTTYFEIEKGKYDFFLKKLKPIFKDYLKSPFTVVNLNARVTKPNIELIQDSEGEYRGPDRVHRDGYPPGHFKCMVYLKPLNDACGKVKIEEEVFDSEKPGFAVLFYTEALHHSIPGTSEARYAIEITLQRTLYEVDILKHYPSTPDSKYFYNAYQAYF
ncbi:MAG: hypothetical protein VW455_10055 [Nitrospinota bacterium]